MADMSPMKAPSDLASLVKTTFAKAKASSDVTYYPTQVAILNVNSIPFQLRFSPALASKPKAPKPKVPGGKPFNPFETPLQSMIVSELPPAHVLVLNKFAIVPEHFILATRVFKQQTHVLELDDIAATYACIRAYRAEGRELFAFFNSGPHSGASQPHRHVQLLPVERMRDGLETAQHGSEWEVLADKVRGHENKLPFFASTEAVSPGAKPEDLHDTYIRLYKRAVGMVFPGQEVPTIGEAKISYNLAMTQTTMALCPRTAEGAPIQNQAGEQVGAVSLNGTVLAGTALVKYQVEWDALREDPQKLLEVLGRIGISSTAN